MPRIRPATMAIALTLALSGVALAAEEPARPIRLNQTGLEANGPKRAILADPSNMPLDWTLTDASGAAVAEGKTKVFGDDAASGEHVHQIDFSAFRKVGDGYRLKVGATESRPFALRAKPDGKLTRRGAVVLLPAARQRPDRGPLRRAPEPGPPRRPRAGQGDLFRQADERGQTWPGCDYTLDASRGWYDAGDQGKYVVNGGISVWTLLNAWERASALKRPGATWAPSPTAPWIPENANGVSDLLDEARWELDFLLAMQIPRGKTLAQVPVGKQRVGPDGRLALTPVDASGMVHQKIADEHWTALPTAPADDKETRYLYHPTTGATLNLAATAAQAARVWKTIDPAFSARCLDAARRAFAAAQAQSRDLRHGRLHRQRRLWRRRPGGRVLLGRRRALRHHRRGRLTRRSCALRRCSWPPRRSRPDGRHRLALGRGAGHDHPGAGAERPEAGRDRQGPRQPDASADRYLADDVSQGYALPYAAPGYPWGSNSSVLNRAMVLGLAYDFTGKAAYRDGAVDAMDYVLGRNPLDRSYVTGFGARPMRNPHHRFWAQQANARYPAPPPACCRAAPTRPAWAIRWPRT
jgi:endoglucanase